jgi:hypothetical protein
LTAFHERLLTGRRVEPTFLITKPFHPETLKAAICQALYFRADMQESELPGVGRAVSKTRSNNTRTAVSTKKKTEPKFAVTTEAPTPVTWTETLRNLEQEPLGANFVIEEDKFSLRSAGQPEDFAFETDPVALSLQQASTLSAQKLCEFIEVNSINSEWLDLSDAANRFQNLISQSEKSIPDNIVNIWSVAVELGSFIELDNRIQRESPFTNQPNIHPELRRLLENLVRIAAPWIRMFPIARQLDDQSGAFLTRKELFAPATVAIHAASQANLLSLEDEATLNGIIEAGKRGELQGAKAQHRTILSGKNLLIVAAGSLASFYIGAVNNEFAAHSILAEKAGAFLGAVESSTFELFSDAPADIREAMSMMQADLTARRVLPSSEVPTLSSE